MLKPQLDRARARSNCELLFEIYKSAVFKIANVSLVGIVASAAQTVAM
jgi:hypothetical protein